SEFSGRARALRAGTADGHDQRLGADQLSAGQPPAAAGPVRPAWLCGAGAAGAGVTAARRAHPPGGMVHLHSDLGGGGGAGVRGRPASVTPKPMNGYPPASTDLSTGRAADSPAPSRVTSTW